MVEVIEIEENGKKENAIHPIIIIIKAVVVLFIKIFIYLIFKATIKAERKDKKDLLK